MSRPVLSLLLAAPLIAAAPCTDGVPLLGARPFDHLPFQEGESLAYEVNWKPLFLTPAFKAGELAFSLRESEHDGVDTFTLVGQARSEGLLASAAGLEVCDRFESIVDRATLRSYAIFRKVRQNNRRRDVHLTFDYAAASRHFREVDVAASPPRTVRDRKIPELPGPVTDVMSVFYAIRAREMAPGDAFCMNLAERDDITRVRIRVEEGRKVETPIGDFDTIRISTLGGLFKGGGDLRVWYSTGPRRVPVAFEAEVRFGKVYGRIIRLESGSESRGVVRIP